MCCSRGKRARIDDSSDSDSSSNEENLDEIVKMVLGDTKNLKENIENEDYVSMLAATPVATLGNLEDSDSVPLQVPMAELSKKR